jgi:hypothetical protein
MGSDGGKRGQRAGIVEFLFDELRSAFQDIRQKVFEEGWFGRVVTAAPVVEMDHREAERGELYSADHQPLRDPRQVPVPHNPSFEELWGPRTQPDNPAELAKERDGHDFDR